MSDEKILYISTEDDLTSIRQRLSQTTSKQLTMVIPTQTQLRSHVAWKLLQDQARKSGKDVLIVSSDPQIRSVAHAVKFRVAHSLEAQPTEGRSRPSTKSTRSTGRMRESSASRHSRPLGPTNRSSKPLFREELAPPKIQPLRPEMIAEETAQFDDYRQSQQIRKQALGPDQNATLAIDDELFPIEDDLPITPMGPRSSFGAQPSFLEPSPEDEQDKVGPARSPVRPHSSRRNGGKKQEENIFAPTTHNLDDPEALSPQESSYRVLPKKAPVTPSPSQRPRVGSLYEDVQGIDLSLSQHVPAVRKPSRSLAQSQPVAKSMPAPSKVSKKLQTMPSKASVRPKVEPVEVAPVSRRPQAPARPARRNLTSATILVVIISILVLTGLLAYLGPRATVTVTMQSRQHSENLSLLATTGGLPTGDKDAAIAGTVIGKIETNSFTGEGTLQATGKEKVGKGVAHGSVRFTNLSGKLIIIPSNTIINAGNTQFKTDAELTLTADGDTKSIPVNVIAVAPGEAGNVGADQIKSVPDASLIAIARASNVSKDDVKISVTNEKATSGGGMIDVPAVSKDDLENAKKQIRGKVQPQIDAWLNDLKSKGLTGQLKIEEALVDPPAVGTKVENGNASLPASMTSSVSVIFVKQADLDEAVKKAMNSLLANNPELQTNQVVTDEKHTLKLEEVKTAEKDAENMTISLKATGSIVSKVDIATIRHTIVGKSPADAEIMLKRAQGIQKVSVQLWPGFVGFLPFYEDNITVILVPGETITPTN